MGRTFFVMVFLVPLLACGGGNGGADAGDAAQADAGADAASPLEAGRCFEAADCGGRETCVAAGRGMCDVPGHCVRSSDCGFGPFCGCDGITYDSCDAVPDGVFIDHEGACE